MKMIDFSSFGFSRPLAPALAGALAAILTLYIYNNYPICYAQESDDWLSIEQVFDFDVPQSVIQTGVVSALENYSNDWAEVVATYEHQIDWDMFAEVVTNTNWWATSAMYGDTNVFYHVDTNSSNLLAGTLNISGLSADAIDLAFDGDDVIARLQHGEALPWLNVPSFADYDLSSLDLPADNPFETANPLIRGLSPPAGWFLDSLPNGALYDAIFGPWEAEITRITSYTFNGVRPFAYVSDLLVNTCGNLQRIIADARIAPRKILALLLSLYNVVLIFRWWLWRLFRIWAIITGPVPSDAVMSGSDSEVH